MKSSIINKLETLAERYEELKLLLSDPEVISSQEQFRNLSKEYADLEPIIAVFIEHQETMQEIEESQLLLKDPDPAMRELAADDFKKMSINKEQLEEQLNYLLLPKDPNDTCNIFLEVRAGTGGDEASIFAGDLARMYMRFAELQKWRVEIVNESHGEHGGYKEVIIRIVGKDVYSKLKFESGAHRVQRVPVTESQGRVHTSACTVAVLPEVEIVDAIEVNPNDLRIDTYRASGAGGQHVNRTDSAVRITHIPSGTVVECQDERSQHKNKAKAMSLLQSKILAAEQSNQRSELAQARKSLVGSGDRSERIRTYNYPQGRITDHRINLTLYKLPEIIAGDIGPLIDALLREYQADLLASISD